MHIFKHTMMQINKQLRYLTAVDQLSFAAKSAFALGCLGASATMVRLKIPAAQFASRVDWANGTLF
jgi:hypothetical protein